MQLDPAIVAALQEIESTQGISRELIFDSLREAICAAYYKAHGQVDNLVVDVNFGESNDIEAYLKKTVVLEVGDPTHEISLDDAKKISEDAEEGDSILIEVSLDDLGYLAIHYAKQRIVGAIKDAKRERILRQYKHRLMDVINGNVLYVDRQDVFVEVDGDVEAVMPFREQIPGEKYIPGQRIKALLVDVRSGKKTPHNDRKNCRTR